MIYSYREKGKSATIDKSMHEFRLLIYKLIQYKIEFCRLDVILSVPWYLSLCTISLLS